MTLKHEDVQEILRIVDQASLREVHLEVGGMSLILRKRGAGEAPVAEPPSLPPLAAAPPPTPARKPAAKAPATTAVALQSPLSGTFYRAPAPGAPPFVEVGSRVTDRDTVCILDVMKVMNAIKAPCAGVVTRIEVANAEAVESGQPLLWIEPA
ncbi:MAG: acetyl-CoA carboxylase biotin carboxyl carrier protein [Alphaproteobacteria bacterium]|nr:acetyl-CoA carboxylase biotin carboxyl carrier protein [Alphaproteobacteria bacterium]